MTSLPGETASQMYEWISVVLGRHGLKFENLISFCADNTRTNFGTPEMIREQRGGDNLFTKLSTHRKNLIPIGCCGYTFNFI